MAIETATLQRFEDLIRARAGLNMRPQEAPLLKQMLRERMQKMQLSDPVAYLDLLETDSTVAQSEWRQLWVLLTNQESYFFRDAGQLSVITDHILPELLRRNRDTRTLRIWSAGCSTGEEPYSLAMMLEEMPELRDWKLSILGTDISDAALQRARRGIYGAWSFRALDERRQERFFRPVGKEWEVTPQLRRNVIWASNNLFGDTFPTRQSGIYDMDLIVCRNVFIYFGRDAVASVLHKFRATLRPGGYLVCGHAELHDVPMQEFKARAFPQSVIYQREIPLSREPRAVVLPVSPPPQPMAVPKPKEPVLTRRELPATPKAPIVTAQKTAQILERATTQIRQGAHAGALETLRGLLENEPNNLAALCLLAQAQANSGQLDEAQASCARALSISPFAVLPYHLQARIAEERGESESAKALFKKVIYLSPRSAWAALELGGIYQRQGDFARAAQMRRAALLAVDDLKDDAAVPAEEHAVEARLSVGELRRQLQSETATNFSGYPLGEGRIHKK